MITTEGRIVGDIGWSYHLNVGFDSPSQQGSSATSGAAGLAWEDGVDHVYVFLFQCVHCHVLNSGRSASWSIILLTILAQGKHGESTNKIYRQKINTVI